jgi:hypothetical protein
MVVQEIPGRKPGVSNGVNGFQLQLKLLGEKYCFRAERTRQSCYMIYSLCTGKDAVRNEIEHILTPSLEHICYLCKADICSH